MSGWFEPTPFAIGDYKYWADENDIMHVEVLDKTKSSYDAPLGSVTPVSTTYAVTIMADCFRDCTNLTTPPDLSNMTAVTSMSYCFSGCTSLATPPDLSNLTSVTNMANCFYGCTKLGGVIDIATETSPSTLGTNIFGSSSQENESELLVYVPVSTYSDWASYTVPEGVTFAPWDISNGYKYVPGDDCKTFSIVIYDKTKTFYPPPLGTVPYKGERRPVTSLKDCYKNCVNLEEGPDLSNMVHVYDFRSCFEGCTSMEVPPDMSKLKSPVLMSRMFKGCSLLKTPPVLSKCHIITDIERCFDGCVNMSGVLEIDSGNVVKADHCFDGAATGQNVDGNLFVCLRSSMPIFNTIKNAEYRDPEGTYQYSIFIAGD